LDRSEDSDYLDHPEDCSDLEVLAMALADHWDRWASSEFSVCSDCSLGRPGHSGGLADYSDYWDRLERGCRVAATLARESR
jgi:hypothetical protein